MHRHKISLKKLEWQSKTANDKVDTFLQEKATLETISIWKTSERVADVPFVGEIALELFVAAIWRSVSAASAIPASITNYY